MGNNRKQFIEDIKNRVTIFIQGKHGMIGIIQPEEEMTEEESAAFHRGIAKTLLKAGVYPAAE